MLEDEVVNCPFCNNELHVKVFRRDKSVTYITNNDCQNCHSSSNKIEKKLNSVGKKWGIKFEKSYIKTDPRG